MAETSLNVWRGSIPAADWSAFIEGALLDFLEKPSEFAASC